MIHKNCSGNVVVDLSSLYTLRSPSISISTRGLAHGMVQIESSKNKKPAVLLCEKCDQAFTNKEEFESGILEKCEVCQELYPPGELRVTDYIPLICEDCIKDKTRTPDDTSNGRYISLYMGVITKGDHPTLLTILMKKGN